MASTSRIPYPTQSRGGTSIGPPATSVAPAATTMLPPTLSPSTAVLSSSIDLPANPCFIYSVFGPTFSDGVNTLEVARRKVISSESTSTSILGTLMAVVRIASNTQNNRLWVFVIVGQDSANTATAKLNALAFEGLTALESSTLTPQSIYACSPACASLPLPCSTCQTSAIRIPRVSAQVPYAAFIDALRLRLLDQIVVSSVISRPVKRLKHGFVIGSTTTSSEWGSSWEKSTSRPLIYTHLQVYISPSPLVGEYQIVIHPVVRSTPYFFLPKVVTPGTPVTLLPHATPAYFLARYTGPTSALSKSFELSISGLGILQPDAKESQEYVIVWVAIENTQGEDKGLSAIWPASLCLSRASSASLDWIPELPPQLQPSPVPGPAVIPSSVLAGSSSSTTNVGIERSLKRSQVSRFDVGCVAGEVGKFVDSIARDREKERERIKREREAAIAATARMNQITTMPVELSLPSPSIANQQFQQQQLQQQQQQSVYPSPPQANQNSTTVATGEDIDSHSPSGSDTAFEDPTLWASASSPVPEPVPESLPVASTSTSTNPDMYRTDTNMNYNEDLDMGMGMGMNSMDLDFGFGLDMDMNMNMGMGDDLDINPGRDHATVNNNGGGGGMSMSMDYDDAFTDDDFSFFDQPTAAPSMDVPALPAISSTSSISHHHSSNSHDGFAGSGLTPAAGPAPLGMPLTLPLNSPAFTADMGMPLQSSPHQHLSPWINSGNMFTPSMLPPSPGQTPADNGMSKSAPATPLPTIQLAYTNPFANHSGSIIPRSREREFEPIPFASSHRVTDGKYAMGKFAFHALPSPPSDENNETTTRRILPNRAKKRLRSPIDLGSTTRENYRRSVSSGTLEGLNRMSPLRACTMKGSTRPISIPSTYPAHCWKRKYDDATDPRIGVVRKLIGARRKSETQGSQPPLPPSPAWTREHEDWIGGNNDERDVPATTDSETEEEEEGQEDEFQSSNGTTPMVSRPSTPLPPYLPLGPTLLHAQFQHSLLLPQSTPLRPPGMSAGERSHAGVHNANDGASGMGSVPTPVSPAAALGAASEKSRSLEAAANIVAREVVDNGIWADAWRESNGHPAVSLTSSFWQADVKAIVHSIAAVPHLKPPMQLDALFKLEPTIPIQRLETPMISIGKGDTIVQVLPTAIRFWNKIALSPRGGKKDIMAFILFEDEGESRTTQVKTWLSTLGAMYTAKHFGSHTLGESPACARPGIVPMHFDSFRKNLASFLESLPHTESSLVIYISPPAHIMSLASPALRQVLAALRKAYAANTQNLLFYFVPEYLLTNPISLVSCRSDTAAIAHSVYDRVLQPVDRAMSRAFFTHTERTRRFFQAPAFSLARPRRMTVSYSRQAPGLRSLDVIDRHTLLHVAYHFTPGGKWIIAAVTDERGEAHDVAVWLTQPEDEDVGGMGYVIGCVWKFAVEFAKKADIEWRVVIAKMGPMEYDELHAWAEFLATAVHSGEDLPMVHVSLIAVECEAPWTIIAPPSNESASSSGSGSVQPSRTPHKGLPNVFVDVSSTTYVLPAITPLPMFCAPPCSNRDLGLDLPFIPDSESQETTQLSSTAAIPILPQATTTLVRVPVDMGHSSISMMHVHLLYSFRSPQSSLSQAASERTHADVVKSYYDLSVLAHARGSRTIGMPFHLGAVEAMRVALDRSESMV